MTTLRRLHGFALLSRLVANLSSAFLLMLAFAAAADTGSSLQARYSISSKDSALGRMLVSPESDGKWRVDYAYRENGRGPTITERFRIGAMGVPTHYEVSGKSSFGAEIREQFTIESRRIRWQSRIDQGDEAIDEHALFIPLESTPAYWGQLFASLIARPTGTAPAIGGAQLIADKITRVDLSTPDGQPLRVALVSMTGADSLPWYLWMTEEASPRIFASLDTNFRLILEGYEAHIEPLYALQLEAQDTRVIQQQQRLARRLAGATVIRNVRWFDSRAARMRGPADVWIIGDRIAAVARPDSLDATPQQTIDGTGRTLLPGLFDMHVHYSYDQALSYLAAGVTTVRDMGNDNRELLRMRARTEYGELPGPHIVPVGFIEGKSRFSSRNGIIANSLQESLAAVDWYAEQGYRMVKLYSSIQPDWVQPIIERARRKGLRVGGHIPAFMRAQDAISLGYNELIHVNQAMLNFVMREGDDTRTLTRFTRVGDDAHRVDTDSRRVREFIKLLRDYKVSFDPTVSTFESMFTQKQGDPAPMYAEVVDHLPALWRRSIRAAEMDLEGPRLDTYRRSFQRMLDLLREMHRADVLMVAGTDSGSGLALHRELQLYVKAGIPAAEALRMATWNASVVAGESEQRGSIERGKMADLVLIDGDPTLRIADLRKTSLVLRAGKVYEPARLWEAQGFKPFVEAATIESGSIDD